MLEEGQIQINKDHILGNLRLIKKEENRMGIDEFIEYLEGSTFFTVPASANHHGNFSGGLAAHSLKVYEEYLHLGFRYHTKITPNSAFICGIAHDLCKVNNYKINPNLEEAKTKPYLFIQDDLPLGHGEKSLYIVNQYLKLTSTEALAIRWHMGPYDPAFMKNADKLNKIPEVMLFHQADMIAANIYGL